MFTKKSFRIDQTRTFRIDQEVVNKASIFTIMLSCLAIIGTVLGGCEMRKHTEKNHNSDREGTTEVYRPLPK